MTSEDAEYTTPDATTECAQPVVFYDGGCPVCRREIEHYRRIDRTRRLGWVDIARDPVRLRGYGITVEQAMRRFHVLDGHGRWQTGAAAFIELWSHLPYYRRLASLVRVLRLDRPLEFVYRRWADWRLQRQCRQDRCGVSHE